MPSSALFDLLAERIQRCLWLDANQTTRALLAHGLPGRNTSSLAALRRLDAVWQDHSDGRFGFSVQSRIWRELGGPPLVSQQPATWDFFKEFGDAVGWRQDGRWVPIDRPESWPNYRFPIVCPTGNAADFPKGFLPSYEVLSSGSWRNEFSPRDGLGEAIWDSWAEVLTLFASRDSTL